MSNIVERLRDTYEQTYPAVPVCLEAAAEIERLRAIERAAERAYRYHLLGYKGDHAGFDANTQIDLLDALGRALAVLDGEKG